MRLFRFFKLVYGSFVLFPHCQCDQLADVANEFGELGVLEVEFPCRPLGGVFSRQSVASIFASSWIADELGGVFEIAHDVLLLLEGAAAFARTALPWFQPRYFLMFGGVPVRKALTSSSMNSQALTSWC